MLLSDCIVVYQLGLIEREINELVLRELGERNRSLKQETVTEDSSPSEQKEVNEGDVCPICQEVISQTTESLTYCRYCIVFSCLFVVCLFVCLFICLFICLFVCLFVCLLVYLFICC